MTLTTAIDEASEAQSRLNSVIDSVKELRQELEALKERVKTEEGWDGAQNNKKVTSATALLLTCQNVENRLVECRSKSAGIAQGGYALDLERARAEIGCKLDRLRCTAGAGTVS